ncbi:MULTISPECIES: hypothetical protein [Paenibacillus]|uniref:hypothetical protein n=1 Tax=Paenibacillus TaxID=44249 RepID=UPI0011A5140B|nr:hypothetical protein [Paenibacillus sp. IHBB 10380]
MLESINELKEKIYHHKTKSYFNEVVSSIEHKNYRSAVVMLYSVVICDLIFKLMDLRDIHNDEKARKILEDLNAEKEDAPVSPAWEGNLIEKSFKEAKLLENDVYTHIITLKNYRNLSAHPVISSIDILFEPNIELAVSLTTSMLEGLLTKSPILSKNVFVPFMEEIERIKNEFANSERLETYIQSKYLQHFNKELTEYIFKNLWKIVFKNNGDRERKNRDINYQVLSIIYKNNEGILFSYIKNEGAYFSEFLDNSLTINKFVDFLTLYPNVYPLLSDHAAELLRNRIRDNFKLLIKAHFLLGSVEEHLNMLEEKLWDQSYFYHNQPYVHNYELQSNEVRFLHQLSENNQCVSQFYDTMISYYVHSGQYSSAEHAFDNCIEPYYKNFTGNQFKDLLSGANFNEQCHQRRYAGSQHNRLLEEAKKHLGDDFDFKKEYPNLF